MQVYDMRQAQLDQRLYDGISRGQVRHPMLPHGEIAEPSFRECYEFFWLKLVATQLSGLKRLQRLEVVGPHRLKAHDNPIKQRLALLQDLFPEVGLRHLTPVIIFGRRRVAVTIGRLYRAHSTAYMNQPEKAVRKDVAEFFKPRPLRSSKWLVTELSDRTADCNLAAPEMVDYAEPVLMIDGRKESVEMLRVNQERPARYKWLLPMSGQPTGVPDRGRIWVFNYLESYDRIFVKLRRRKPKLSRVYSADVIIQEEHTCPSAHAAD